LEKHGFGKNNLFNIEKEVDFSGIDLKKNKHDYQIMATFNFVIHNEKYKGYKHYKLVTEDINIRLMAYSLFSENANCSIECYKDDQVEHVNIKEKIPVIDIISEGSIDFSIIIYRCFFFFDFVYFSF
jgi:hypothetical protein